jgi:predicted RNA binding protein YcfA (HicA-like mRNA interferase family)
VSEWPSAKASQVLAALKRSGWRIIREKGSHRTLERAPGERYVWAFHDGIEIGPKMLARIAKQTGLKPDDL